MMKDSMLKTTLTIGAHPDDAEQFAGGDDDFVAADGVGGAYFGDDCGIDLPPKKVVAIRRKEAEAGAVVIGASYYNLGLRDGCLEYSLDNVKRVVDLI